MSIVIPEKDNTQGMVRLPTEYGIDTLFSLTLDGSGTEFVSHAIVGQDYVPTIMENHFKRMSGRDGWTKERTMRQILSVPVLADAMARDAGYDMTNRQDVERFFRDHPQFRTVEALKKECNAPNIIIK